MHAIGDARNLPWNFFGGVRAIPVCGPHEEGRDLSSRLAGIAPPALWVRHCTKRVFGASRAVGSGGKPRQSRRVPWRRKLPLALEPRREPCRLVAGIRERNDA